ncbi:CRISPR-associated endonuclease Cas4g/Cas1g [Sinimarinibacterium thermocellulolyticum]|uniref:CRISPR-associated endonuclease Cas1 n=1 Tax=Sinimarinibacterium thermocellulolyticum TaxID=3170016 RepID=A0ABV2A6G9_9GAMM
MTDEASVQRELPLPFPELSGDLPLLPARMVNEYEYCPRLAYLEWVQGEWADSHDTVQGRHAHRRVDRPKGDLPPPDELEDTERLHARSITLSSNRLGLIAKLDLIEADDGRVVPVDYKKGKRPHVARGAYDPERVQLCVQGLILREHGYVCDEGVLYYAESRERVPVVFDDELISRTLSAINGLRLVAAGGRVPPPLEDSPKCPRCSLVGICLPDEVNFLNRAQTPPRPLAVGLDEALPLYVQANKAKVSKDGETLVVSIDDEPAARARLGEISQLVLQGNVYVTTPTLHELMRREVPIVWQSYGGWFLGYTAGMGHKNVELRTAQYRASFDEQVCLRLAKGWVAAKIHNQRVFLRRNWRGEEAPQAALDTLEHAEKAARRAASQAELLGIEGNAAAAYFGSFSYLIKSEQGGPNFAFDFHKRNRRPPADAVNALLSFAYATLTRACTIALVTSGFDPYRGFYHQPRYGRPSLALDLMEPFRPLIADSSVIQAINNGEVRPGDFVAAAGSVNLDESGRKRFLATIERRMSHEITHPLFGYKLSYRRLLDVQARLLGRHLLGEIPENPNLMTR